MSLPVQTDQATDNLSTFARLTNQLVEPSPQIEDVGERRQARLISTLLFALAFLVGVRILVGVVSGSAFTDPTVWLFGVLVVLAFIAYGISRTKYYYWAVILALVSLSILIHSVIIIRGDYAALRVQASSVWLALPVLFGALVFPWWGGLLLSIANLIPMFLIPVIVAEIPSDGYSSGLSLIIVITVLVLIINRNRDQQEQDRRQELLVANRQTEELANTLAERVAAATRDLELAAEVGQRLSLVRETDRMLTEAVNLIRDRFSLYYTQVYLTDPSGRSLVLRAGTGEVGETLIRRSHRLAVDLGSLNGVSAIELRPVLVEDTENNPLHRPNPLLPDTRSELVVPLIVNEQVVGTLDLQSSQPETFSSENLAAYQALAGQLAIAIANARLFEAAEQARTTMEEQSRRLTREGWQGFLDAIERQERLGYRFENANLQPLEEPLQEDFDSRTLAVPIEVAGTQVGAFQLQREQAWTEDEQITVNAVSQQVAQQIENLRLLNQAEQYQDEAQEILRRLTRENWDEYQQQSEIVPAFVYNQQEVIQFSDAEAENDIALAYDIQLRGEAIGQFGIEDADNLSEDDMELVQSVSEQLSAHIENLRLSLQTEQALALTETLYEIGSQLNQAVTAEEILTAVSETAISAGCQQSSLMLIENTTAGVPEWIVQAASWTRAGDPMFPVGSRYSLPEFPSSRTLLASPDQVQMISDIETDELVDEALRTLWLGAGSKAIVIVPIVQAGRWLGLLTFSWVEPHEFSQQERSVYNALISLAAPTIQSQQLLTRAQTRAQREQSLRQITNAVRSSTDPATIMRTAVRELGTILGRQTLIKLEPNAPENQPENRQDTAKKTNTQAEA